MAKAVQSLIAAAPAASMDPRDARIAELEAQLASRQRITVRVGKSGTVSVYGLQRFPVSLHPEQWERLLVSPGVVAEIGALCQMKRQNVKAFEAKVAEAAERAEDRKAEASYKPTVLNR